MSDSPEFPTDEDLRALSGPGSPPAGLEERVVSELRRRGLLARHSRGRWPWLVAAGFACLAAGWLARGAAKEDGEAPDDRPLYLLLLSRLPTRPDSPPESRLVEEYRAWAVTLRHEHRLVRAEKLGPGVRTVGTAGTSEGANGGTEPSGFFLIRANDIEEATAVARACPHVRHGGSVTIRSVDPT